MTVEEAARSFSIKEESVRKRVRRGTMRSEKDPAGRLYTCT
jgi:excisionase family DNA binding protein